MIKKPIAVEVTEGESYYWCACGLSGNQPFCDGSHQGTGKTPIAFTAGKSGTVHLCACTQSGNGPYCDGNHRNL